MREDYSSKGRLESTGAQLAKPPKVGLWQEDGGKRWSRPGGSDTAEMQEPSVTSFVES